MRKSAELDGGNEGLRVQAGEEVQDLSLSEHVYRHLRRDILNGVFAPGQALKL